VFSVVVAVSVVVVDDVEVTVEPMTNTVTVLVDIVDAVLV